MASGKVEFVPFDSCVGDAEGTCFAPDGAHVSGCVLAADADEVTLTVTVRVGRVRGREPVAYAIGAMVEAGELADLTIVEVGAADAPPA